MMSAATPSTERDHWHLDKRLNVGHLLTTVVIGASVLMWAGTMDKRVTLLEASDQQQKVRDENQDTERQLLQQRISGQLSSLERKIDRMLERELERNH